VIALLLLCLIPAAHAEPKEKGKVDHLALAALLLKDGHLDRAAGVLAELGPRPKLEGAKLARFHTLSGVVAYRRRDHAAAVAQLGRALRAGARGETLHLLLARSHFALGQLRPAIEALGRAGAGARRWPGAFLLEAQCHWRLGDRVRAWGALQRGSRLHPKNDELARQRVLLLVDMGLYRRAAEEGERFLARPGVTPGDFVAFAEALRRGRQVWRAILLLEQGGLRFPKGRGVLLQLARAYLDAGKPLAAGRLLHRAALADPRLLVEAAELYRRAGQLLQALHLNAQVPDQKPKVRQRLGLLIELERFEEAAALEPRLARLGLLDDQKIIYALAYAHYRAGDHGHAEAWLKRIREPGLFDRAAELRRAMAACAAQGWTCQ